MSKTTPHKHADVIKAWADGAEIQWLGYDGDWHDWSSKELTPSWDVTRAYRVKPQPHKWQKEMDAQAAGKVIQYRNGGVWTEGFWHFNGDGEYRIKPEPVVQDACLRWVNAQSAPILGLETGENYKEHRNIRFTFEDGKLVKAEVI